MPFAKTSLNGGFSQKKKINGLHLERKVGGKVAGGGAGEGENIP